MGAALSEKFQESISRAGAVAVDRRNKVYPPVESMICVVLVDEDHGSIGDTQHAFSKVQMGVFGESCISIVPPNLSFVNIYLSLH
jgi:hypothetical protein